MNTSSAAGIHKALENDRLIDITTMGRNSAVPHRVGITFHSIDGEIYIADCGGNVIGTRTGSPIRILPCT